MSIKLKNIIKRMRRMFNSEFKSSGLKRTFSKKTQRYSMFNNKKKYGEWSLENSRKESVQLG